MWTYLWYGFNFPPFFPNMSTVECTLPASFIIPKILGAIGNPAEKCLLSEYGSGSTQLKKGLKWLDLLAKFTIFIQNCLPIPLFKICFSKKVNCLKKYCSHIFFKDLTVKKGSDPDSIWGRFQDPYLNPQHWFFRTQPVGCSGILNSQSVFVEVSEIKNCNECSYNQGCRSRCFWVEPELFLCPGALHYAPYSFS